MAPSRFPRHRFPEADVAVSAAWTGMTATLDPTLTTAETRLHSAWDNYRLHGIGGMVSRPGWVRSTDSPTWASGARLQHLGALSPASGSDYLVAVVAGQLWGLQGAGVWTLLVTTADLTSKSITLSATARVYGVPFKKGVYVFSDGINKPFAFTGGTGAAAVTAMPNAPVAMGQPVVYYRKLFLISLGGELMWSEEEDVFTGYGSGGFNNAWALPGTTHGDPLRALAAYNESLYVFRGQSITEITGAVNSDFRTTATRSSVSSTVGVANGPGPQGEGIVLVLDAGMLFNDQEGIPTWLPVGGKPRSFRVELGGFGVSYRTFSPAPFGHLSGEQLIVYSERLGVALMTLDNLNFLVFDFPEASAPNLLGIWTHPALSNVTAACDGGPVTTVKPGWVNGVILPAGTPFTGGFVIGGTFQGGTKAETLSMSDRYLGGDRDPVAGTVTAVLLDLLTQPLAYDSSLEKATERLNLTALFPLPASESAFLTVRLVGADGTATTLVTDQPIAPTMLSSTTPGLDDDLAPGRLEVGGTAVGRWFQVRLLRRSHPGGAGQAASDDQRFGVAGLELRYHRKGRSAA